MSAITPKRGNFPSSIEDTTPEIFYQQTLDTTIDQLVQGRLTVESITNRNLLIDLKSKIQPSSRSGALLPELEKQITEIEHNIVQKRYEGIREKTDQLNISGRTKKQIVQQLTNKVRFDQPFDNNDNELDKAERTLCDLIRVIELEKSADINRPNFTIKDLELENSFYTYEALLRTITHTVKEIQLLHLPDTLKTELIQEVRSCTDGQRVNEILNRSYGMDMHLRFLTMEDKENQVAKLSPIISKAILSGFRDTDIFAWFNDPASLPKKMEFIDFIKSLQLPQYEEQRIFGGMFRPTGQKLTEYFDSWKMVGSLAAHLHLDIEQIGISIEERKKLHTAIMAAFTHLHDPSKLFDTLRGFREAADTFKVMDDLEQRAGVDTSKRPIPVRNAVGQLSLLDKTEIYNYMRSLREIELQSSIEPRATLKLDGRVLRDFDSCSKIHEKNKTAIYNTINTLNLPNAIKQQALDELSAIIIENGPNLRDQVNTSFDKLVKLYKACSLLSQLDLSDGEPASMLDLASLAFEKAKDAIEQFNLPAPLAQQVRAEIVACSSQKYAIIGLEKVFKMARWMSTVPQDTLTTILARSIAEPLKNQADRLIRYLASEMIEAPPVPESMATVEHQKAATYVRALHLPQELEQLALSEIPSCASLSDLYSRCHKASYLLVLEGMAGMKKEFPDRELLLRELKLGSVADIDAYIGTLQEVVAEEWEGEAKGRDRAPSVDFISAANKAALFRPDIREQIGQGSLGKIFALPSKTLESSFDTPLEPSTVTSDTVVMKQDILNPSDETVLDSRVGMHIYAPGEAKMEKDIMDLLATLADQKQLTPFERRYLLSSLGGRIEKAATTARTPYDTYVSFFSRFEGDLDIKRTARMHMKQKSALAKNLFNCLKVFDKMGLIMCDIKLPNMLFKGDFALFGDYGGLNYFEDTMTHPTPEKIAALLKQIARWTPQTLPFAEYLSLTDQLNALHTALIQGKPIDTLLADIQPRMQAMVRFTLAASLFTFLTGKDPYPRYTAVSFPGCPLSMTDPAYTTLDIPKNDPYSWKPKQEQALQSSGCDPGLIQLILSCLDPDPNVRNAIPFFQAQAPYFES